MGNKQDIKEESDISEEDIEAFKKDINMNNVNVHYTYTSAKNGVGIEEMFRELIENLLKNPNIGKINSEDDGDLSISIQSATEDRSHKCPC